MNTRNSYLKILFGTIALLSLLAAINKDFSFSAKGILVALSHVRFKNDWLTSLQDLADAFEKIVNMKNPFDFISGLWNMQWSLVVGVWNFVYNFIYNIIVILRFLLDLGFKF